MRKFFYPESLAIIGLSASPGNLCRSMLRNLRLMGYKGRVYGVGPTRTTVDGVETFPSVGELPEVVDLVGVLAPARAVPGIIRDCGEKGITRAAILTGGFAELDDGGRALQQELADVAKLYGLRFIGPNGMGLLCPESGSALVFAGLGEGTIRHGPVTILSQSGSVALLTCWLATHEGLGIAKYVSMGNKVDVDEVDLLPYFIEEDGKTKTICLYLEGSARGRELCALAARSPKPVVILKANISQETEHAARSHTASLASDDRVVEGAFRQSGITRVKTVREFVVAAKALSLPPLRGDNVAVIASTGGVAVIATDFCYRFGFQMPALPAELIARVGEYASARVIPLGNPLDLGAVYDNYGVLFAIEQVAALPEIDGLAVSLFYTDSAPLAGPHTLSVIERVGEIMERHCKPIAVTLLDCPPVLQKAKQLCAVPVFSDIEECMAGLAMLRQRSRHLLKRRDDGPCIEVDKEAASKLIAGARSAGLLDIGPAAMDLLEAYGIPVARLHFAGAAEEAASVADRVGYPVVLKAVARNLSHKSDIGGVALDLADAGAVWRAFGDVKQNVLARNAATDFSGVVVQPMVRGGHELILGAKRDPHFGPVVMFGFGGIFTEVFEDVSFRLAPLTLGEAGAMVQEVKAARILRGVRGQPPADVPAIVDALARLGQLIADHEEIDEVDVNPMKVFPAGAGAVAVDARVVLARS